MMRLQTDPSGLDRAGRQVRRFSEKNSNCGPSDAQPMPEPLLSAPPPPATYPVDALGPLQDAIEAAAAIPQAPVEIAAQTALTTASLVSQALADVRKLGGGWAPLSLFAITLAVSGERKGAVDRLLLQGVRDAEAEADLAYQADHKTWKRAHKAWSEKLAAASKAAADIMKPDRQATGEAALAALGDEPQAPKLPQLLASDPTPEGLWKLFAEGQPSLGLFNEEAGTFLGGHGMSKDHRLKTISFLSKLWNADPVDRVRAGDGAAVLRGRRLATHLMLQPSIAAPLLADPVAREQGFLPRILVCHPVSRIGGRFLEPGADEYGGDYARLTAFAQRCRRLLERPKPWDCEGSNSIALPVLELNPDAMAKLMEFYNETEAAQAQGQPLASHTAFASKIAEQAARISGVLTVFEDETADEVGPAAMQNAIVLASYYLGESQRLMETAQADPDLLAAEQVRTWILEHWPQLARQKDRDERTILPADLYQHGPRATGVRDSEVAKVRLECLAAHGWLIPAHGDRIDGRLRKTAWRINESQDAK